MVLPDNRTCFPHLFSKAWLCWSGLWWLRGSITKYSTLKEFRKETDSFLIHWISLTKPQLLQGSEENKAALWSWSVWRQGGRGASLLPLVFCAAAKLVLCIGCLSHRAVRLSKLKLPEYYKNKKQGNEWRCSSCFLAPWAFAGEFWFPEIIYFSFRRSSLFIWKV